MTACRKDALLPVRYGERYGGSVTLDLVAAPFLRTVNFAAEVLHAIHGLRLTMDADAVTLARIRHWCHPNSQQLVPWCFGERLENVESVLRDCSPRRGSFAIGELTKTDGARRDVLRVA